MGYQGRGPEKARGHYGERNSPQQPRKKITVSLAGTEQFFDPSHIAKAEHWGNALVAAAEEYFHRKRRRAEGWGGRRHD